MRNTVRCFVAVEVPPEVKERAGQLTDRLRVAPAKVKWVAPSEMHWTLKFLGDVDLVDVPEICAAVSRAAAEIEPFDVEASGAGAFPDHRRPRTVWIGMRKGSQEMIALHGAIERELAKLGYRQEGRLFRPHLTIGRVRNSPYGIDELGSQIAASAEFDGGISTVYEVAVFASELGPKGPTYELLGHADLRSKGDQDYGKTGTG